MWLRHRTGGSVDKDRTFDISSTEIPPRVGTMHHRIGNRVVPKPENVSHFMEGDVSKIGLTEQIILKVGIGAEANISVTGEIARVIDRTARLRYVCCLGIRSGPV